MTILEECPIDATNLLDQLVAYVSSKVTRETTGRQWTEEVKKSLRSIGKSLGRVVAPDPDEGFSEFMLDLVWWRNKESNNIDLAVESEWGGTNDICHDFGKLLSVKAPLKLMIYSSSSHDRQSTGIRESIEESCMKRFAGHISGERYLLVEFVTRENRVYAYSFVVPGDGALAEVKFHEFLSISIWRDTARTVGRE